MATFDDSPDFAYDGSTDTPLVPFVGAPDTATITVTLNGASRSEVEAYLQILIPFYVSTNIIWQ